MTSSRGLAAALAALQLFLAASLGASATRLRHVTQTAKQSGEERSSDAEGEIPGWGQPRWGGRSFGDSVAANNIWGQSRPLPMVENMDPIAPLDRVDKTWSSSLTGAVPYPPTDEAANSYSPFLRPKYQRFTNKPRVFPADGKGFQGPDAPGIYGSPQIPMEDRHLYAKGDWVMPDPQTPIVAQANALEDTRGTNLRLPVAAQDRLPAKFARYIDQVHAREVERLENIRLNDIFKRADTNRDGSISRSEFEGELKGRQNKTDEEVEKLWGKYHLADASGTGQGEGFTGMGEEEYSRLAKTGFDLGGLAGSASNEFKGVSSVLTLPFAPRLGFWGSGARCKQGQFVVGARLKVMPISKTEDNTALNGAELLCSDGTTSQTVMGGDGEWTAYAQCPEGQRVNGFRARTQRRSAARDNTGLLDLELSCAAQDLSGFAKLRYGSDVWPQPGLVIGKGPSAAGGGWTPEQNCAANAAVCGMQANVVRYQGNMTNGDNMGIADLRVYCCSAPVDCSAACGAGQRLENGVWQGGDKAMTVKCRVCRKAASLP